MHFLVTLVVFFAVNVLWAMGPSEQRIIPNASYYIGNEQGIFSSMAGHVTEVKFYNCDGDHLSTLTDFRLAQLDAMIDSQAQRPKPTDHKIVYWQGAVKFDPSHVPAVGWLLKKFMSPMVEGKPGHILIFIDKNGNHIFGTRVDSENPTLETVAMLCDEAGLDPTNFWARISNRKKAIQE